MIIRRLFVISILSLLVIITGCTVFISYSIQGTVYDENSKPLEGATVFLDGAGPLTTMADGKFYYSAVEEGTHMLKVVKEGYLTKEGPINVTANSTNFTVNMERATTQSYTITVNVYNASNQHLTNASVKLIRTITNQVISTKTGSPVSFSGLQSGNYTIQVTCTDYNTYTESFTLSASMTKTVKPTPIISTPTPAKVSGLVWLDNSTAGLTMQSMQKIKTADFSKMSAPNAKEYDGVLVEFYSDVDDVKVKNQLQKIHSNVKTGKHGLYKLETSAEDIRPLMEKLKKLDGVKHVQPNYINRLFSIPNDSSYSQQWNLHAIKMPSAWDLVKGNSGGAIVAVLDTGIRYHADLEQNLVLGYDVVDDDNDPTDDVTPANEASHGTHVASIIAAVTNNSSGLAGVGWNLKVMPIKVFHRDASGNIGATDQNIADGIRMAVLMGADVINLSLGGHSTTDPSFHPVLEEALAYAETKGVSVFAASGNDYDNRISYPATSTYTMAVGAVGYDGKRAAYSNFGSGLDIVAPGGHGDTSSATDWIQGYGATGTTVGIIGTSQATPHVAAVAGLLYNAGLHDPNAIYTTLIDSASTTAIPNYSVYEHGAGLLNAEEALLLATTNQTTMGRTFIYAGTVANNSIQLWLESAQYPSETGAYTLTNVPANVQNLQIIGWTDLDGSGTVNAGDYFGMSSQSYTFTPGQTVTGVDFALVKQAGATSTANVKGITYKVNLK